MRVGVAQIEPRLGELERNRELCVARVEEAAAAGCALVVLPECASSGYVFDSAEEALPFAEELGGPFTDAIVEVCARHGIHCVSGMLEREGDALHNAAILAGPQGLVGRYRKTHLPFLGVDRFVAAGEELPVFDTPIGRIGIEICYDLRFPELTRTLALRGAEIVAQPTNWPMEARSNADVLTRARAHENRIFLLTSNRVGQERDARFCGWSQICDVWGNRLVEADGTEQGLFVADIETGQASEKDIIPAPGKYEMRLFSHRRPELYGALVEETTLVQTR